MNGIARRWRRRFDPPLRRGKPVSVDVVDDVDTDRYGRLVGVVTLEDGRNVNRELVRGGMAWWYRKYAPKDSELERLETEAREARRGLWQDKNPTPPGEWRRAEAGR